MWLSLIWNLDYIAIWWRCFRPLPLMWFHFPLWFWKRDLYFFVCWLSDRIVVLDFISAWVRSLLSFSINIKLILSNCGSWPINNLGIYASLTNGRIWIIFVRARRVLHWCQLRSLPQSERPPSLIWFIGCHWSYEWSIPIWPGCILHACKLWPLW